jgi:transposase-like protein
MEVPLTELDSSGRRGPLLVRQNDVPRPAAHYLPHERLAILAHRERYGMSLEATAKAFLVSDQTLANWISEVEGEKPRVVQAWTLAS